MKNYLLILNGVAIADFVTRGRAENAFRRMMYRISQTDMLSLHEMWSGRCIASNV